MTSMENNDHKDEMRERLLDFVAYVLTSAKGLYREPYHYGPMRIIDTLEKSLSLMQELGLSIDSLETTMAVVRENRWMAGTDAEGFAKALDEAILQLVGITIEGPNENSLRT